MTQVVIFVKYLLFVFRSKANLLCDAYRFLSLYLVPTVLQHRSCRSLSLSNLNLFSKFLHCWKACDTCYKTRTSLSTSPVSDGQNQCLVVMMKHSIVYVDFSPSIVCLNFPLQDSNKQPVVLDNYNYFGSVVPENKWGKVANYNIRSQF